MRQRSFEIIRKRDLEGSSFLINNVRVHYVGTCPETGISFYCNNGEGGVIGVRVYPEGWYVNVNAKSKNNGNTYCHSKEDYLLFRQAFGRGKNILAARAVYMAAGRTIPQGMTIDHIDGCTTNNYIGNLRCVSNEINKRDGGFLGKLRKNGFKPACIDRAYLLRYYERMAYIKDRITYWQYKKMTKEQLRAILFLPDEELQIIAFIQTLKTPKKLCQTTSKN